MNRLLAAIAAALALLATGASAAPGLSRSPSPPELRLTPSQKAAFAAELAVIADPLRDAAHPARNQQLLLESHGAKLNALFFLAQGPGPHPTMLLLHGLPGNERNLDLAQAVRRAGWNVLTFTYRGAWGSEGDFSITNSLEDAEAALAFLRTPEAIRAYGIDIDRLVIAGHSMGGLAAAVTAAHEWQRVYGSNGARLIGRGDPPLAGLVLIDAWNAGQTWREVTAAGEKGRAGLIAGFDDFGRALHGATPESVADELLRSGQGWDLRALAPLLANVPVLSVYATHGIAEDNRALVEALRNPRSGRNGAKAPVTATQIDSDHSFADSRIRLASEVVQWLQGLQRRD